MSTLEEECDTCGHLKEDHDEKWGCQVYLVGNSKDAAETCRCGKFVPASAPEKAPAP